MYATISSGWSLALFLLCAIVFVGISILFLFLRKKINIACEVIVEASKCVMFFPSTLLFPLLPCFICLIVTVFSGTVGIALYVIAVKFDGPLHVKLFHIFNSFGYLWVASFIGSLSQFILSGTFATWFWTHNKNNVPKDTLVRCTKITFNHHLGTIAFGSLILAVCQFIKALLNFIKKRLEGKCNPLACLCCGCYTRLFGRLEKIVRYINRNAYIMCAVHGKNFLESAKDAFNLLMRNVVKVFIINNVTDVILFLGQVFATTLSVLGAYKYCTAENMPQQATSFVLIAVLIISLMTTTFISTALRIAIDTIFLCVLEDYERNDGSERQPYYMSFKLKTLFLEE
ncbi:CTL-like protein 2 [Copidosoma floridanum]|uniref:CTL-like protein 2 n=1 Tax=Copidosoma floridanum TaxID=29053 RepID=UPI000C6F6AAC|nr:CTL-like protein 2 [Copidosoma floridanum]